MTRGALLICALGFLLSCQGGPPRIDGVPDPAPGTAVPVPAVPEPAPEPGHQAAPPAAPVPAPDTADAPEPPALPGEGPLGEDLAEPVIEFAESNLPETPPPQGPFDTALPEPQGPREPPAAAEPPVTAPALPPPAPAPAAPVTPPPAAEPPVPEAPPPFIRPAEPVPPPPAAREPVPVPVNPVPPLPARPQDPDEEIVYSRTVRATVGQLIEIPFRGTGWVYLGELGSRPGAEYNSRRLDAEGQSFVFRAEAAGTYGLKFYKQDFIRDYILNDYVRVIIGEAPDASGAGWFNPPVDRGRVVAEPRWPALPGTGKGGQEPAGDALPDVSRTPPEAPPADPRIPGAGGPETASEAALPPGAAPPVGAAPPADAALPSEVTLPPEAGPGEYVRRSREEYDAGRIAGALGILDQFRERFPSGSDEAWWLYGQLLEANSPSRDIRSALDYYRRLVREYPQSERWEDARRRIAYLERYYFDIR